MEGNNDAMSGPIGFVCRFQFVKSGATDERTTPVPAGRGQQVNGNIRNEWFAPGADLERAARASIRFTGGGVHQTKTMMLAELSAFLLAAQDSSASVADLVIERNVLGKSTNSARKIALSRLTGLYGIAKPPPIAAAQFALWRNDPDGRPLLALLMALARDPLLRDSAAAVLPAAQGTPIRWTNIAASLETRHPDRFSFKMMRTLAQNCASTWTQSGHLRGRVKKVRAQAQPTAAVAALSAFLATVCGFGGPALLESPWFDILDLPPGERLSLLRRAEAQGYARIRTAGDMLEITVRQPLAQTLGIPGLADV
jgi:hypothetical protein